MLMGQDAVHRVLISSAAVARQQWPGTAWLLCSGAQVRSLFLPCMSDVVLPRAAPHDSTNQHEPASRRNCS
jgi:hypothetical protein